MGDDVRPSRGPARAGSPRCAGRVRARPPARRRSRPSAPGWPPGRRTCRRPGRPGPGTRWPRPGDRRPVRWPSAPGPTPRTAWPAASFHSSKVREANTSSMMATHSSRLANRAAAVDEARVVDQVGPADVLTELGPEPVRLQHHQGDEPAVAGAVAAHQRIRRCAAVELRHRVAAVEPRGHDVRRQLPHGQARAARRRPPAPRRWWPAAGGRRRSRRRWPSLRPGRRRPAGPRSDRCPPGSGRWPPRRGPSRPAPS